MTPKAKVIEGELIRTPAHVWRGVSERIMDRDWFSVTSTIFHQSNM
jgi:hypothetical protein